MMSTQVLKKQSNKAPQRHSHWRICALALILSACAPMAPISLGVSAIDPQQLHLPSGARLTIASNWWEDFQNKDLSTLIQNALEHNPSIALANTRIEKAQALAGLTRSASLAQMGAGLEVDRQRFSQTGIYPPQLGLSMQTLTTLQLSGAWIPDVFGKHKAAYESAIGQVHASALDALHAKSQLSAQIVLQFIALALSMEEIDLLQERSKLIESLKQLMSERIKAGLDSTLELKTLEIENNDLRIQSAQINNQIDMFRHSLAALSAREPSALSSLSPRLRDLHAMTIQTDFGIDLLGRRADVVAAKTRVLASIKNVDVAKLDFYPNLSLGFFAGYNTLKISQLTENSSAQYGVLPSLSLPIFDGGRLNAQLSAKTAEKDQAVAIYNNTLLEALKEASDALSSYKASSLELQFTQNSLALATEKLDIQTLKTKAGLGNQTTVLREKMAQLQQQRALLQWSAKQRSSAVLLLKSLGAGWPQNETHNNVYAQKP